MLSANAYGLSVMVPNTCPNHTPNVLEWLAMTYNCRCQLIPAKRPANVAYNRWRSVLERHKASLAKFNEVQPRQLCLQSNKWHWEKIQAKKRVAQLQELVDGLKEVVIYEREK